MKRRSIDAQNIVVLSNRTLRTGAGWLITKTKEKEEEQKHQKHEHVGRLDKNKVTSS